MLHWFLEAAITKYLRLGDLNSSYSFLHNSEGWKSEVQSG